MNTTASSDAQVRLTASQTKEFYHDHFVAEQMSAFGQMLGPRLTEEDRVVDIGGGCGYFAGAVARRFGVPVAVIDTDPRSIEHCREAGIQARQADALAPCIEGNETIACFNMVLHHLVGPNEGATRQLQTQALRAWHGQAHYLFVNEYIYESYGPAQGVSGRVIWVVTSSRVLSMLAKAVARIVPSLRANTFGVGVRFRTRADWLRLFDAAGYEAVESTRSVEDLISPARRLLLIGSARRDSFLLKPKSI
jgi:hypothetical protein